ncbi:hypothetical protein predicted by Glimmer/Critica [Salmonella enterica subsp. enterica serovar Weltevreden str. 2007-60-3289-1]|nr:hypothetical protein predicted by Glimmer/Critica [Salmonella enterica subsp. enterica serovar Weltevreden str. 2007-60-3289-1]
MFFVLPDDTTARNRQQHRNPPKFFRWCDEWFPINNDQIGKLSDIEKDLDLLNDLFKYMPSVQRS